MHLQLHLSFAIIAVAIIAKDKGTMDSLHYAKEIVQKLESAGFIAYFAGGWVRDFVMGHPSEDIDIATNASPVQIMDLFPRTTLVGLQFGVVIVAIDGHQFEVATFRKDLKYIDGRHPEGIIHSTPTEDALRRDFTINGMFYDPIQNTIHDYVGGREDILKRVIRTIGNPHERFHEDRLRMLRAFRFEARFGFSIELETQQAIIENAETLFPAVAMERVWQEFNKMSVYPRFDHALVEMHRLLLLSVIFPELKSTHLNEIKHLTSPFPLFPKNTPTILYLIQLFPHLSTTDKVELASRLKCSHKDITLIEYFDALRNCASNQTPDLYQWTHLLADTRADLCLEVIAAIQVDRESYLKFIAEHKNRLNSHIQRIIDKKPLISAILLIQQGIKPGPLMGALLKEAESIAIHQNIHDSPTLLLRLSETSLWKQNQ